MIACSLCMAAVSGACTPAKRSGESMLVSPLGEGGLGTKQEPPGECCARLGQCQTEWARGKLLA